MVMLLRAITVAALAVLCASVVPTAASAATIAVTVPADTVADDGQCSLREAVTATNLNADVGGADDCDHDGGAGADTIMLPEPATQYSLAGAAGEDGNIGGDLDISAGAGGLTIKGAGALATPIDAGDLDRVLHLEGGELALRDLALRDGKVASSGGGVLANASSGSLSLTRVNVVSNEAGSSGGGILAIVPLTITGGSVASNKASAPIPSGGGIAAFNTTSLTRTTVSGNSVTASTTSGVTVDGGGIAQGSGGSLTVADTSVHGNSVTANPNQSFPSGAGIAAEDANLTVTGSVVKNNSLSGGNIGSGGGLHFVDNGDPADNAATIKNTTIAGNDAESQNQNSSGGGGLKIVRGVTELSNVTIAGNTADLGKAVNYQDSNQVGSALRARGTIFSEGGSGECALPGSVLTTMGYNVDEGSSCIPADGTSLQSTDPLLGSLASNGGRTSTMALPATSPAIDLMPPSQCEDVDGGTLGVDQRGVPRPFGAGCEPGAYERSMCRGTLVGAGAIIGTPTADDLRGTTGDDVIVAGNGQDDVGAGGGGDRVCAGAGGDTLNGAPGDDKLSGEEGSDTLSGGKDDDNCNGGPGTDSATGCEVKQSIP